MTNAADASFQLFSISFGGSGTPPMPMRDLLTNQRLGAAPEWVIEHRSAPAAYPRGTTVTLQAVFQASNVDEFPSGETYSIEATGAVLSVTPRSVAMSIQPLDGFSQPVAFSCAAPLPDEIGIRQFTLDWTATDAQGRTFPLGTSAHTIYMTWQALDANAAAAMSYFPPYQIATQLAVQWAAGQTTVDGVAGAILNGIAGLQIARSIVGRDARMVLLLRKADSIGFTILLCQMLAAHGIAAVPRAIDVDWTNLPADALQWIASTALWPPPALRGTTPHVLCVFPSGAGVTVCDAEAAVGPVHLPAPMFEDHMWSMTGAAFDAMRSGYLVPAARVMAGVSAGPMPAAPIEIFSVHFLYPGSQAIPLHDPVTDQPIGQTPEWVAGTPEPLPAAFVRGTTITMMVTFLRTFVMPELANAMLSTIGATGAPVGVTERQVQLAFGPDGRSDAIPFTLAGPVSPDVATTTLNLDWYSKNAAGTPAPIGSSTHPLLFTWKPVVSSTTEGLMPWCYSPLVKWTSEFAAGAQSDQDVCDRVFANLSKTGLKYGVAGWTPRQMLLGNGGMCGGWYQLFQAMLACQGVLVQKRAFLVDWRSLDADDVQWNAIVVSSGGLNQPAPPVTPSQFHDLAAFPIPAQAALTTTTAPRYRFWGEAGGWSDGHCVNFAVFGGQLYLYDASFSLGPIALAMPMPPSDGSVLGGAQLADFVAKYLSRAVSHMLGSFKVNGQEYRSAIPAGADAGVNGVSVVTSALPTMVGPVPAITFKWI